MLVAQTAIFADDFEHGLSRWEVYGEGAALIRDSGDAAHGKMLVLRPQGDAYALMKGSVPWGNVRIEGDVLFPENTDNYLGLVYNFTQRGNRRDFGVIYIKGNGSYLAVNPHRDFNVGRTLYEEFRTPLTGKARIVAGQWQHFKVEVIGNACTVYVGEMDSPQLTFSLLELTSGAMGLQPRSVGGDAWVDNITVTPISAFSSKNSRSDSGNYDPGALLTDWRVSGPFIQTNDSIARHPERHKWAPFDTDARGAVITGKIVDFHGPKTVAYWRTQVQSSDDKDAFLHFSTVDDLALWVNGRFQWFIPRAGLAWYDFWQNGEHKGQRIPVSLKRGNNELVLRVRGGVYASGGFYARLEQ